MQQGRCPSCGTPVSRSAAACPACGAPTQEASAEEPPALVASVTAAPRRQGAPVRLLLLCLGSAALGAAAGLVAAGHWPWGLALLGVALLVLVPYAETRAGKREAQPTAPGTPPRE